MPPAARRRRRVRAACARNSISCYLQRQKFVPLISSLLPTIPGPPFSLLIPPPPAPSLWRSLALALPRSCHSRTRALAQSISHALAHSRTRAAPLLCTHAFAPSRTRARAHAHSRSDAHTSACRRRRRQHRQGSMEYLTDSHRSDVLFVNKVAVTGRIRHASKKKHEAPVTKKL